jgi:ATP adenylyltransferase
VKDSDKETGCIFCDMLASSDDEANLVLRRFRHCFVVLNKFPYISGHLMVVPNEHVPSLESIDQKALHECIEVVQLAVRGLREEYQPDGFNVGMNIGKAAGAGIVEHVHMHAMPRWSGDTNFISTVSDTRVIPEDLGETYRKLKNFFDSQPDVTKTTE